MGSDRGYTNYDMKAGIAAFSDVADICIASKIIL